VASGEWRLGPQLLKSSTASPVGPPARRPSQGTVCAQSQSPPPSTACGFGVGADSTTRTNRACACLAHRPPYTYTCFPKRSYLLSALSASPSGVHGTTHDPREAVATRHMHTPTSTTTNHEPPSTRNGNAQATGPSARPLEAHQQVLARQKAVASGAERTKQVFSTTGEYGISPGA
jgi:hypothetical protein